MLRRENANEASGAGEMSRMPKPFASSAGRVQYLRSLQALRLHPADHKKSKVAHSGDSGCATPVAAATANGHSPVPEWARFTGIHAGGTGPSPRRSVTPRPSQSSNRCPMPVLPITTRLLSEPVNGTRSTAPIRGRAAIIISSNGSRSEPFCCTGAGLLAAVVAQAGVVQGQGSRLERRGQK